MDARAEFLIVLGGPPDPGSVGKFVGLDLGERRPGLVQDAADGAFADMEALCDLGLCVPILSEEVDVSAGHDGDHRMGPHG